ncbi:MAG: hypothetical protein OXQ29_08470, partial [Rhodospirillaceae bacterium]|nr:hypothetical protein [Rhodospirillaceae bacterium]
QHALISGTSYDEFLVVIRHVGGSPERTNVRNCRIPGIQGDWVANSANALMLLSESGACSLSVPPTGNITVRWVPPLAGNKLLGDSWRLYGIDWSGH